MTKRTTVTKRQQADEAASSTPTPVKQHFSVNPFMVYETQRSLIRDDVHATQKLVDPGAIQDEGNIVMHQGGFKRRTKKASLFGRGNGNSSDDDIENKSVPFKVCCCCCYLGKKYFNIGFGWMIMAVIIALLIGVALLKFDENVFFYQSAYDLEKINYYELLEVAPDSSLKDVKRAHRKMVIKWHPDRNPGCGEECVTKMAKLSDAILVLSNAETRAFHDKYGVKPPEKMIRTAQQQRGADRKSGR
jgi:hypothetical protein